MNAHDEPAETDIPILVVDDVRDNLDLMEVLLAGEGYTQVLLADRGVKALALLDEQPDIGLVLLDLMMPDMDGYEVCRRINSNPLTRHIPVIVVTGAAFRQNEALNKSFAAGAIDYINKPLNEIELFARIRVALALYRERRLRQASARIVAENEARFRLIINQAPVGIAHIDQAGRFLLVNDALCGLTGYARAHLQTLTLADLIADDPERATVTAFLAAAAGEQRLTRELCLTAAVPVWVSLSATPLNLTDAGQTYVAIAEDITERKATADKMARMVFYDALTRLPNRVLFNERLNQTLQHAQRSGGRLAVLFLDLDNFKTINDSLGHTVGDQLLQRVAERIQGCIRKDDLFARFGGDEFTFLISEIGCVESACIVAQKVLDQLERTVRVDEHDLYVGASIGISIYPQDGEDAGTLIKNADTAMYRAKELGRRNYQLFNPALDIHVQQRLDIEQELRRSLAQGDFALYYQPQIDLRTDRINGMEALLRWRHPKRGLLSPLEFLPLAEETGLIIALGDWVLREACRQARLWYDQGHQDWVVYVNLSRRQFQQPDLLCKVEAVLVEQGLPAQMLGIEITESVNSLDTQTVISSLQGFRDLGIRTALDDFGLGYSSLNNLKHFPLNALKIDKSFVLDVLDDQDDLAIVKTVLVLGRSFGLEVIAEGVENERVLELLRQLGCDMAQGYYFSEPLPAEQIERLADRLIPLS